MFEEKQGSCRVEIDPTSPTLEVQEGGGNNSHQEPGLLAWSHKIGLSGEIARYKGLKH